MDSANESPLRPALSWTERKIARQGMLERATCKPVSQRHRRDASGNQGLR